MRQDPMASTAACAVLIVSADEVRSERATSALSPSCQVYQTADMSAAMDEISIGRPLIVVIDGSLPADVVTGLLGVISDPDRAVLWVPEPRVDLFEYGPFTQIPHDAADSALVAAVERVLVLQGIRAEMARYQESADRLKQVMDVVTDVRDGVNSPLTAIMAEAELVLMDADQLTPEHRKSVETIQAMTLRIRDLLTRLHELGKAE
jgi:signal transduction histidine kinase